MYRTSQSPVLGGGARRRSALALIVVGAFLATPFVGTTLGAQAAPAAAPARAAATTAAVPTVAESPDYASEVYHDAWDYSQRIDQNTDQASLASAEVANGVFTMSVGPGSFFDPVDTIAGSVAYGRDGAIHPVDTNRYRRLSFSMNQPNGGIGAVYWFTCREKSASCTGGTTFALTPGSHVYDIPLDGASTLGAKVPWTSASVVSLRVQPVVVPGGDPNITVVFDWLRLHAGTSEQAALPPGSYSAYTIQSIPQPIVDSPSPADGADLATVTRGRPWEFTDSANAAGVTLQNATLRGYGSTGLTAVNAGPDQNDPIVRFPVSNFSGSKYHWLSWDMTYDGPFSLADTAGGGKLARVHWTVNGSPYIQIGNDMVTFSGTNAVPGLLDLATNPIDETQTVPRYGWSGQTINSFRFDPNEDPGTAVWHLKSLHLRADPAATGSTTVKFHDAAWVAGTTADILVGTGAPGSAYTTISSGIAVANGVNSSTFALGSLPAGSYTVEVVLHHPVGGGALAFSGTPITMSKDTSHDPRGSFDTATNKAGSTSVRLKGWSYDPDTTATTSVAFTEQSTGASLGQAQTGATRKDVAQNVAGAPGNTGWAATLTLSAGKHTVCASAVNVGAGNGNVSLGCKTVTITNGTPPRGSFDTVKARPTNAGVRGWAWDPDAAAGATQVRVVDRSAGNATVGTLTANLDRSDVQKAVAGAPLATGYSGSVPLSVGTHDLCISAINVPAGSDVLLGCKTVTVG